MEGVPVDGVGVPPLVVMKAILNQIGLLILDLILLMVVAYVSFKYVIPNLDLVTEVMK